MHEQVPAPYCTSHTPSSPLHPPPSHEEAQAELLMLQVMTRHVTFNNKQQHDCIAAKRVPLKLQSYPIPELHLPTLLVIALLCSFNESIEQKVQWC